MSLRPTQSAAYDIVSNTLSLRLAELVTAQQETSSGKRIQKPSDDPVGASLAINLQGEQAAIGSWRGTAAAGGSFLDATNTALSSAEDLIGQVRALAVQGLSGTMKAGDRLTIADQLEQIRGSLLDVANTNFDGKYLFAGTASAAKPFAPGANGAVSYHGNDEIQTVILGRDVEVPINAPGSAVFQAQDPKGLAISGVSGLAVGASPSQGKGWVAIDVRHDTTTGAIGSGVTLAGGGANDTIIGDRTLTIDGAARTVRLGSGTTYTIPNPTDPGAGDFIVRDEHGALVHLDLQGFDGTSSTSTLTGTGSIRAGDGTFMPIDLSQSDVELDDPTSGAVLRVDETKIVRASQDIARFSGTVDVFSAIDGVIADLRNSSLSLDEVQARMEGRLAEVNRNQDAVLDSISRAGAASTRLQATDSRLSDQQLAIASRLSQVQDIDPAQAILAMTRAQQSLELTQMTASRVLQTSLLDYLK
jgi:flagellar hook-associated protein 3 FlgL